MLAVIHLQDFSALKSAEKDQELNGFDQCSKGKLKGYSGRKKDMHFLLILEKFLKNGAFFVFRHVLNR